MNEEIIIAGFGGQGVLSMGKILAYAGMLRDLDVSWMPSYGPEMRGGTANVMVILSDQRISSPILTHFDTAIILNQQSMDKFEPMVKPGGILLYDPNGINRHPERNDIRIHKVSATEEAAKMQASKIFNMILLGGYLKLQSVLTLDDVVMALKKTLPARHHKLIPMNAQALEMGMHLIDQ